MDKAKANTVMEFWVFEPFFDVCGAYYGDAFSDCLKQVGGAYPDLNLSQIVIDNIVPPTPKGDDTVSDKIVDFIHMVEQEVKDTDGVVIVQPTPEGLGAVVAMSVMDPSTADGASVMDPAALDVHASIFFSLYLSFLWNYLQDGNQCPLPLGFLCKNIYPFGLHSLFLSIAYTCCILSSFQLCMPLWY